MPEVGRMYLEDEGGYVAQAQYRAHPMFRSPEIRVEGRVWAQVRQVDGAWVYRALSNRASLPGFTQSDIDDFVHPGEFGWVAPGDYVTSPSPAAVALAAFEQAVKELQKHPEHADLVKAVQAAQMPEGA